MTISKGSLCLNRTNSLEIDKDVKKNSNNKSIINSIKNLTSSIHHFFKTDNTPIAGKGNSTFFIPLHDENQGNLLDINFLQRANISALQKKISLLDEKIASISKEKRLFLIPQTHQYLKSKITESLEIDNINRQNTAFDEIIETQTALIEILIKKLDSLQSSEIKTLKNNYNSNDGKVSFNKIISNISKSQESLKKKSATGTREPLDFKKETTIEVAQLKSQLDELSAKYLQTESEKNKIIDNLKTDNTALKIEKKIMRDHYLIANNKTPLCKEIISDKNTTLVDKDILIEDLNSRNKEQRELIERLQKKIDDLRDAINEKNTGLKILKKISNANTEILKNSTGAIKSPITSTQQSNRSIDELPFHYYLNDSVEGVVNSGVNTPDDINQLHQANLQLNAEKEILATLIEKLSKEYELQKTKCNELMQTREEEKSKGDPRIKLLHHRSNMGDKEQSLLAKPDNYIKYKPSLPVARSQEKYTELMDNVDTCISMAEENDSSLNSVTQREKISTSSESLSSHSSGYLSEDENTYTVQYSSNDVVDKPTRSPFALKPNKRKGYRFNQQDQDRHEGKAPLVTVKQSTPVNVKGTRSSELRARLHTKK